MYAVRSNGPAPVAQWIEQPPPKRKVASSTLAWGTTSLGHQLSVLLRLMDDSVSVEVDTYGASGSLETTGGVGVLVGTQVTWIGLAALVGLAALMAGAITSRVRVCDSAVMVLGDVVVLALVVSTFVALLSA